MRSARTSSEGCDPRQARCRAIGHVSRREGSVIADGRSLPAVAATTTNWGSPPHRGSCRVSPVESSYG